MVSFLILYVMILLPALIIGVVYSIRPEDTDVQLMEAKVTSYLKVSILMSIITVFSTFSAISVIQFCPVC